MARDRPPAPRTFFLNEQHELTRGEKEAGGSLPKLAPINWKTRGEGIHSSLVAARAAIQKTKDPLGNKRFFLTTLPATNIRKQSKDLKRAPNGIVEESIDYAGDHSRVFKRLGLDLLSVDKAGQALVHAPAARLEQLLATSSALPDEGPREQARWVAIDSFAPAPKSSRIDETWLQTLPKKTPLDAVVELQPFLTRVEIEQVIQAIIDAIGEQLGRERFTRTGTDFSGRHWYRGMLSPSSLKLIAEQFFSVQALHSPLLTEVAASVQRRQSDAVATPPRAAPLNVDLTLLPVVAVVDVGVPADHATLTPFRRGRFAGPNVPPGIQTDHASRVASRVVFGDPDLSVGVRPVSPGCAFYDVNVAADAQNIDDKAVIPALQAVVGTSPDVRVFNLSFGEFPPLDSHPPVERREKLLLVQDLDNFVFQQDVLVILAAGNSRPGLMPSPDYPNHFDDPRWALGSWACGFNTLKCGSYVGQLSTGLVSTAGWPSPFTRVGPGLCKAPIPEYSANGGNCTDLYGYAPGLGVWAYNASGAWEDLPGTSYAAPMLAREAAFAFAALQRHCEQGAKPFAATAKAFLALTADPPSQISEAVRPLALRTLGRGTATSRRLGVAEPTSAVMVWQGVLAGPEDKARIQVPIPLAWMQEATKPILRVIAAWESPVNAAVEHIWAARRVECQLRQTPAGKALPPKGRNHPTYPLLDRLFDLSEHGARKSNAEGPPDSDFWILEVSYKEVAEYVATIDFSPHQRVGIAMELRDAAEVPASPQAALQALPQAVTMGRLTVPENRISNPIVVKLRV